MSMLFGFHRRRWLILAPLMLALLALLPSRDPVRRQLLALMQQQRHLARLFLSNFQNQFSPGFKARHPWRAGLIFSQGKIFPTQLPSQLAINGQGCFGLVRHGRTEYGRDGRLDFRDGVLSNPLGWAIQGYRLDAQGNPRGPLQSLQFELDPVTNLYSGRYTGYHFDEQGKFYGEQRMTDPVTGQSMRTDHALFQLALFALRDPQAGSEPSLLKCDPAYPGTAGQGALGSICPASLESSNVDFVTHGAALKYLVSIGRWCCDGLQPSQIQNELESRLTLDSRLRQMCLNNLQGGFQPGYRSRSLLPWLCGESRLTVSQDQGPLLCTGSPADLALEGEGYFVLADGTWKRTLNLESEQPLGYTPGESQLRPMKLPPQASQVEVSQDGSVRWTALLGDGKPVTAFRLALAKTPALAAEGTSLRPAGPPTWGMPGQPGFARVAQGYLEMSNEDGYQRRIVGAAMMHWAGLPLLAEPKDPPTLGAVTEQAD